MFKDWYFETHGIFNIHNINLIPSINISVYNDYRSLRLSWLFFGVMFDAHSRWGDDSLPF